MLPARPLPEGYTLLTTTPTLQDYSRLRLISGLTPKSEAATIAGLPNTLHSAQILHIPSDTIVGMGRIIGDNGLFYQIVDIGVDPAHQRRGLAKAVMGELMRWLEETGKDVGYVSLIADGKANQLYEQFGFKETAPRSIGMAYLIRKPAA